MRHLIIPLLAVITTFLSTTTAQAHLGDQIHKFLADDGEVGDNFGHSVALDGDTAVVGVPSDDDNGNGAGAVYIFVRNDIGVWTFQTKLVPDDGTELDNFGISVAISGDMIVVGSSRDDDNGYYSGSAYIFVRNAANVWDQQDKLLPSNGASPGNFGISVAISGDTAIVGAFTANINASGLAYIFVGDEFGIWTQQAKLMASNAEAKDHFGSSVAINGDTAAVGAPGDFEIGGESAGSAYIWVRTPDGMGGFVWTQQAKLTADDGASLDYFGLSLGMSNGTNGGDTVIIGAPGDDDNGDSSGSAYVYVRKSSAVAGSSWKQQTKLLAPDGAALDGFGLSVAVSGDMAVVGAHSASGNEFFTGAAYSFVRDGGGLWTQQAKILASDGLFGDDFGHSVALDGDTAVVGERFGNGNMISSGVAYVFDVASNSPCPWDLDNSGSVGTSDLLELLSQWGTSGSADFDESGVVGTADLLILLANWGPCK